VKGLDAVPTKPLFERVIQIGLVVKDLDAAMRDYWELYGIGPWRVYRFDPSTVERMVFRGQPVRFAIRLASADIGGMDWELIQPSDDRSPFAKFLREHGEGLHHIAFEVADYEETLTLCRGRDIGVLHSGLPRPGKGGPYTYLDTQATLRCIAEIWPGVDPPSVPESLYPPDLGEVVP
jgi:hypothetical protein